MSATLPSSARAPIERSTADGGKSARSVCECAEKPACWKLVMGGTGEIMGLSLKEVEAAMPGRFFPGAETRALRRRGEGGHFLDVRCGKDACPDRRDELEKRLIAGAFLRALPPSSRETLVDSKTWAISGRGAAVLAEAKRCRPGLWTELGLLLEPLVGVPPKP